MSEPFYEALGLEESTRAFAEPAPGLFEACPGASRWRVEASCGIVPRSDDTNVPQAAAVMDAAANRAVWKSSQQGLKNCLALLEGLPSLRLLLVWSNFKYYMTTSMMAWLFVHDRPIIAGNRIASQRHLG